ncbi:MAG: 50S ribosomal protein L6 [Rhodothermales bacterium]|nr:50S ribosomal protein L6 [Rhodothermales bacterium]MBO6781408.1 50S ribosomal protein L6 [Rhodothermales bacterium]
MSRVGKLPIEVKDNVQIQIGSNNFVQVKGPKGELSLQVDPDISVSLEDGQLTVTRPTDQKRHRAMHGLYRSLLDNMVIGVSEGYKRELEVIGVGFRAAIENGVLELALGFSHPIYFVPPEGIDLSVDPKRGKNTFITVEGIDKQLVGQVAAKIRSLRPPEPYKGKGVRYADEYVRRKAGKTAAR